MTPGLSAFQMAYEISPIILVGGIADKIPGQMLPIISITEPGNLLTGLVSGGDPLSLDNFFAHYIPLPGSSLIDQDIAQYPFANQTVAANSVMTKALNISFQMIAPAKGRFSYVSKMPIIMMLQKTLENHNATGGTYTLLTPSFIYLNCLMVSMRDTSQGATKQVQNTWQLDFQKPLITVQDAVGISGALNGLMRKLSAGSSMDGEISTSGFDPASGAATPEGQTDVIRSSPGKVAVPYDLNQQPTQIVGWPRPGILGNPDTGVGLGTQAIGNQGPI
jgi:hypothetical protein